MSGYCDRQDIEDIYGSNNVKAWANLGDLDGEDSIDKESRLELRIQLACDLTADIINAKLYYSNYVVPFEINIDPYSPVLYPSIVIYLNAQLAGIWLYDSRGVDDTDSKDGKHRLSYNKEQCENTIKQILSGEIMLSGYIKPQNYEVIKNKHTKHHNIVITTLIERDETEDDGGNWSEFEI